MSKEEIDRDKYLDLIVTIKSVNQNRLSEGFTTQYGQLFLEFISSPLEKFEKNAHQ